MRRRPPPESNGEPAAAPAAPPAPTMLDVLSLPEDARGLMNRLLRHGPATAAEAAELISAPPETADALLRQLEAGGFVQREPEGGIERFRTCLQKRGRELPGALWDRLEL